jgi:MerR family mercuric resistance operon transcriptional regulator
MNKPKSAADDRFAIGELSRRTGVGVEAIRYYERIALMPRPPRTQGGRRAYRAEHLRVLSFIKRSRELGFCLDDIRALLALRASKGCCVDVKAISGRHLETVRTKMRGLMELERVLAAIVSRCPGDESPECPVLDVLELGVAEERASA